MPASSHTPAPDLHDPAEVDRASSAATHAMMRVAKDFRAMRPMPLEVKHYALQAEPTDRDWATSVEPLDRSWILFVQRDGTPCLSYRDEETGLVIPDEEHFARRRAKREASAASAEASPPG